MLKKEEKIIIILASAALLLLVIWFATRNLLRVEDTAPVVTDAETKYNEADAIGTNDKVLVYEATEKDDIIDIKVKNEHGSYRVYRDKDNNIQIHGFEGVPFHNESMSALMTSLGKPTAMYRIENPSDIEQYGLTTRTLEDGTVKEPATFEMTANKTVTNEKGEQETVQKTFSGIVGEKIVSGGGYYFYYNDTPNVVYVVDTGIEETVLAPVETLVAPMIVPPMTDNDYFIVHDLKIMKGDETIVHIDYIEEEDRSGTENVTKTYEMVSHPDLVPSAEAVSAAMLGFHTAAQTDALSTVSNILTVVQLGIDKDTVKKYNLVYKVSYTYKDTETTLYISPRNTDGSFYAASPLFQQVVKGDSEVFDFITWDLFDWVESPFFQMKINFVTDISVESGDYSVTFDMDHTEQPVDDKGNKPDPKLTKVTDKKTGKEFDVENFRQFFKTLLYASYEGESGLMKEEIERYNSSPDSEAQLILTIHTGEGRELRYRFFRYSKRRSYVELNGEGQFYCLSSMVEKIIADAKRVQNGEPIGSTDKY